MANAQRFNVKITLGEKSYPPGEDVPDADKITSLTAEKRDLVASLRQLENDNQVLAARVSELEKGAGGGST